MEQMNSRVNVAVPEEMRARVERLAEKQNRRASDVVRAALSAYLRKEETRR